MLRTISVLSLAILFAFMLPEASLADSGWSLDQARAYGVSTVTDGVRTTRHIYMGIMVGSVPTTVVGTCPGPDYYNCNVARLGSCSQATVTRTIFDYGEKTWTETYTGCTSPSAGSCKSASGMFGVSDAFGRSSLSVDSLATGFGCPF